uniref:Uncharacterized protein n=1 Tax=Arundo donax TaxID=35708 RepID=A0A0A9BRK5_ARUDO
MSDAKYIEATKKNLLNSDFKPPPQHKLNGFGKRRCRG